MEKLIEILYWTVKKRHLTRGIAKLIKARANSHPNLMENQTIRFFVNRNRYDKTLAYVTVYNGGRAGDASVDLSGFLEKGKTFGIWDGQNYFAEPIMSGAYDGKPILLPLKGKKVTAPTGKTEQDPVHTGTDLSVFVVRKMLVGSDK